MSVTDLTILFWEDHRRTLELWSKKTIECSEFNGQLWELGRWECLEIPKNLEVRMQMMEICLVEFCRKAKSLAVIFTWHFELQICSSCPLEVKNWLELKGN